jgi:hypothetical protein
MLVNQFATIALISLAVAYRVSARQPMLIPGEGQMLHLPGRIVARRLQPARISVTASRTLKRARYTQHYTQHDQS